jgi:hypothetical protein
MSRLSHTRGSRDSTPMQEGADEGIANRAISDRRGRLTKGARTFKEG